MAGAPTSAVAYQDDQQPGESGLVVLLCLYLVLLAFFILLNSMTQPDPRRTRDVLESVHEAFEQEVRPVLPPLPAQQPAPDSDRAVATLAAALSALLGELGRLEVSAEPRGASVLRLELESGSLFEAGAARPRASELGLLDSMAAALSEAPLSGFHVEVEVLHGIDRLFAQPDQGSAGPPLAVARGGALVRALVDRGVPAERLAAGLLPGAAGSLQFLFRLYDSPPADPLLLRQPAAAPLDQESP